MDLTLGIVTGAALLDSVNPCAISVLILTIGFLLSMGKVRAEVMKIGLTYIFSLYLTYLFIGLGVLQALTFFGITNAIAKFGAAILATTAIVNLLGYLIPKFPIRLRIPKNAHGVIAKYVSKGSFTSAAVLGVLVGLFEFPCTGGPYLSILSLIHGDGSFTKGLTYLLYYNLIFVSPLIVILAVSNSNIVVGRLDSLRKKYTKRVDIFSSLLMLALSGIIYLST